MTKVQIKVPGKLYIAGEYAVVEPGYSAIITAVDLFIHMSLTEVSEKYGSIFSEGFTTEPIHWDRKDEKVHLEQSAPSLKYILSAIHTVEDYVKELGIPLSFYQLKVSSELDSKTGQKLGLGSSGAITVATVKGLLEYYKIKTTDLLIYKLSVLAQLQLGVHSSFGDLAAITYTGWIHYTSFDRNAVLAALRKMTIKEVVEMDWPFLNIQRLEPASDVQFLIGWTGSPASSNDLVGNVQKKKQQSPTEYQSFLDESKASVDILVKALETNNIEQIQLAVERNRQALLKMGQQTNVLIETPQLSQLIEIAQSHGGAAKTSGAGGGDSGIAFVFDKQKVPQIIEDWQITGIIDLPLTIYNKDHIN